MVEKSKSYDKEIQLVKIYVTMDLISIKLFQSRTASSLFHEIPILSLIKLGQRFQKTTCFDLVASSEPTTADVVRNKFFVRGGLTLCTTDVAEEKNWVGAIMNFKQCKSKKKGEDTSLLADFYSINGVLKKYYKPPIPPPKAPIEIIKSAIFYSNKDNSYKEFGEEPTYETSTKKVTMTIKSKGKIIDNPKPPKPSIAKKVVQAVKKIQLNIEQKTKQKDQIKKELTKKLADVKSTAKALVKKKEIIQELLQTRKAVEKEKKKKILQEEHTEREVKLLDQTNKKINKVKLLEMQKIKSVFSGKIQVAKNNANLKASELIKCMKDTDKDLDPYTCYDRKLVAGFEDKEAIKGLCVKYFGEVGEEKCQEKPHFCGMCCGHFVGIKHMDKLKSCKDKCTKMIDVRIKWRDHNVQQKYNGIYPKVQPWPLINIRGKVIDPNNGRVSPAIVPKGSVPKLYNIAGKIHDSNGASVISNISIFKVTMKLKADDKAKEKVAKHVGNKFMFTDMGEGEYIIKVTGTGYADYNSIIEVTSINYDSPNLFNIVVSKPLKPGQFRVVLTWKAKPKNLASKLFKNKEEITSKRRKSTDGMATFDTDDTSGYGPQIISFTTKSTDVFKYQIKNLSGEVDITKGKGEVRLYHADDDVIIYSMPDSGIGKVWHVFDIKKNSVSEVNKIIADFV